MASLVARILLGGCILVLSGVISFLTWFVFFSHSGEELPLGDEDGIMSVPTLEDVLDDPGPVQELSREERFILEQHFDAIGGIKSLSLVRSIWSTGTISFPGGGTFPIVVIKSNPNQIRVTVTRPEGQLVLVSSPEDKWRCLWKGGSLLLVEDLDQETADGLFRSSYVVSELFLSMQNSWTVEYVGQKAFNYEMAHCFEVVISEQSRIRFFIDPETFLDVGREEWNFDPDGELLFTRIIIKDHMDIGELTVGKRLELFENNALKHSIEIDDVEVNPGVLPETFTRPDEALVVKAVSAAAEPDP